MEDYERPSVLGVGLEEAHQTPADLPVELTQADCTRRAIEMLRVMRFDLLLVALRSSSPPWNFVQAARRCSPGQKWMLVGPDHVSDRDEITARSLGATSVLAGDLDWDAIAQIACGIRDRELTRRIPVSSGVSSRDDLRVQMDEGAARSAPVVDPI